MVLKRAMKSRAVLLFSSLAYVIADPSSAQMTKVSKITTGQQVDDVHGVCTDDKTEQDDDMHGVV